MSSENPNQAAKSDQHVEQTEVPAQADTLRRQAINFSLLGGLAALVAACGKTVTRFDKKIRGVDDQQVRTKNTQDPSNPTAPPDPSNPMNPAIDPSVPGPGLKPGSCLPVSVQIVDVSDKSGITVDAAAVAAYKLYNGRTSKLLAIKLAARKIPLGGYVHLVGKAAEADTSGKILATRRVQSTDLENDQAGLIFETLVLMGSSYIDVVLVNGEKKSKQTIDVRPEKYHSKVSNLEVVDLAYGIIDNQTRGDLFKDLAFGGTTAPTMAGTSEPSGVTLGNQFGNTTMAYKASNSSQKWNVAALVPSGAVVENLFGEIQSISETASSDLFVKSHSFAVYRKQSVGGKDYMVRYFFFVG